MASNLTPESMGKIGGNKTKELHGVEHFSKAGTKGHQSRITKDPDYYKKLRAKGIAKQKAQKEAQEKEKNSPLNRLSDLITGK